MSILSTDQIEKVIKVVDDRNIKWAQAKSYATHGSVPAGWTVKNEPHQLALVAKQLLEENKQLKLKLEQLEVIQNVSR